MLQCWDVSTVTDRTSEIFIKQLPTQDHAIGLHSDLSRLARTSFFTSTTGKLSADRNKGNRTRLILSLDLMSNLKDQALKSIFT